MLVGETSERTIAITRNTGRNVCVPAVTLPLPGEMACSHMKAISFTLAPTRCIFRRFDEAGILFRRTKTAQCLQGCGRLCGRGLVADPGRDSNVSIFGVSKLGDPARDL